MAKRNKIQQTYKLEYQDEDGDEQFSMRKIAIETLDFDWIFEGDNVTNLI